MNVHFHFHVVLSTIRTVYNIARLSEYLAFADRIVFIVDGCVTALVWVTEGSAFFNTAKAVWRAHCNTSHTQVYTDS